MKRSTPTSWLICSTTDAMAWREHLVRPSRVAGVGLAALVFLSGGCAGTALIDRDAPVAQAGVAAAQAVNAPPGPAGDLQRHLTALQSQGLLEQMSGGSAQLLIDGPATFKAMFAAIEQAHRTVLLESYIVEDAAVAQRLATLLKRKRAEGVQVALIYDDVGSFGTATAYFDALRANGVATCAFNPVVPKRRIKVWNLAYRDHRKILVVDGEVAFTGGINISAVYRSGFFSHGRPKATPRAEDDSIATDDGWRDTQVQITGPAAAALDTLVRETWEHQGCQPALPSRAALAVAPRPAQPPWVAVLPSSPLDEVNRIYAMLLTAIEVSRRRVWFTMAYFAPTADMIAALCDAARRGADVRLILPSQSDFSPVLHAGRSHYSTLLAAGVKLYELQGAVLHAKTVVIDGVLSSVGSSNLDWRSFAGNNEVNAVVFGEAFAQRMQAMFERDLQACRPINRTAWEDRPLRQRAKEAVAGLLERLW